LLISGEELDEKANMKPPEDIRMILAESTSIQTCNVRIKSSVISNLGCSTVKKNQENPLIPRIMVQNNSRSDNP